MSHEIRTPMNAIWQARCLERSPLSCRRRRPSTCIRQAGSHSLALINDIRPFEDRSRQTEVGISRPRPSSTRPTRSSTTARARRLSSNPTRRPAAGAARRFVTRLRQALAQLSEQRGQILPSTAASACVRRTSVVRRRRRPCRCASGEVSDSGIGIAPEQLPGCSVPSSRPTPRPPANGGTGLRLSLTAIWPP